MKNGNAALEVIDNETAPAKELRTVNERIRALIAQREAVQAKIGTVEAAAAPIERAGDQASSLRQQRRGLFGRMLRLGRVDPQSDEVLQLDRQIAATADAAGQAQAVAEARAELMSELTAEQAKIAMDFQAAYRDLRIAQHAVAAEEIRATLCPKVRSALNDLGDAIGRLEGAGVAHIQLTQELREKFGVTAEGVGAEFPMRELRISLPGFAFADRGGFNLVATEFGPQLDAARAEFAARWRAFGQTK